MPPLTCCNPSLGCSASSLGSLPLDALCTLIVRALVRTLNVCLAHVRTLALGLALTLIQINLPPSQVISVSHVSILAAALHWSAHAHSRTAAPAAMALPQHSGDQVQRRPGAKAWRDFERIEFNGAPRGTTAFWGCRFRPPDPTNQHLLRLC
jgi:hypothetical protein